MNITSISRFYPTLINNVTPLVARATPYLTVASVAIGVFAILGVCFAYYHQRKAAKAPQTVKVVNVQKPRIEQDAPGAIALEKCFSNVLLARLMVSSRVITFGELIKVSLLTYGLRKKFLENNNNRLDLMRYLIVRKAIKLNTLFVLSRFIAIGNTPALELGFQICHAQHNLPIPPPTYNTDKHLLGLFVDKLIELGKLEDAFLLKQMFFLPNEERDFLKLSTCRRLARQDNSIDEAFRTADEIVEPLVRNSALHFIIAELAKKPDADPIKEAIAYAKKYKLYEQCLQNIAIIRAKRRDGNSIEEALELVQHVSKADLPLYRFSIFLEAMKKGIEGATENAIEEVQKMPLIFRAGHMEEAIVLRANQEDANAISEALSLATQHLARPASCFAGIAVARMKKKDVHAKSDALKILREKCEQPEKFLQQFVEALEPSDAKILLDIAKLMGKVHMTFDGVGALQKLTDAMVTKILSGNQPDSLATVMKIFNCSSNRSEFVLPLLPIAAYSRIEHLPRGVEFSKVIESYNSLVNPRQLSHAVLFTSIVRNIAERGQFPRWEFGAIPTFIFAEFEKAFATNTQE